MRIGIAGYMGAGKTTCARLFESEVTQIIDADTEAKTLMSRDVFLQNELRRVFGDDVVCGNGNDARLRFDILGGIVFESIDTLKTFNGIVHANVVEHIKNLVINCGKKNCILDAALIPLWDGAASWFDFCVWVDAPFETRKERLLAKRGNKNSDELLRRMKLQEEVMPVPKGANWVILPDNQCYEYIKSVIIKEK